MVSRKEMAVAIALLGFGWGVGGAAFSAAADIPPLHEIKLRASDPLAGDRFGFAVGIGNERIVVGAFHNDDVATDAGAAYLFHRAGGGSWNEIDKLVASDGTPSAEFGSAVALDGDFVAIGAPGAEVVYIHRWTGLTWEFDQKLTALDGAGGDAFGHAVAIDEETIVVGAPGDDAERGAAYVFVRAGGVWSEVQKLVDPDGQADDNLGASVDLDGAVAVAGAIFDFVDTPVGLRRTGSASVFVDSGSTWSFDEKLFSAAATTAIQYGRSVAIDAGVIAVGAPQDIAPVFPFTATTGTVFRYDATVADIRATQIRVWASDGQGGDDFGASVALDDDLLAIGSPGDRDLGAETGSFYLFDLDDNLLNESKKVTASDAVAGDRLGFWVGVSGGTVIASADLHDLNSALDDNAGQAYVVPEPGGAGLALAVFGAFVVLARSRRGWARA